MDTSCTRPLDPTKCYYTAVTLLRCVHEAIVDLAHGVRGAHAVLVVRNGVDLKAASSGFRDEGKKPSLADPKESEQEHMKKCDGSLQVCPGSCCVHCVEGDGVGEQPPGQCPATIHSPEQLTLFYRQGIVRAAN